MSNADAPRQPITPALVADRLESLSLHYRRLADETDLPADSWMRRLAVDWHDIGVLVRGGTRASLEQAARLLAYPRWEAVQRLDHATIVHADNFLTVIGWLHDAATS